MSEDLTAPPHVGILANMRATLLHQFRDVTPDGDLIEMIIWRVPDPVPPSQHAFKYRLAYVVGGKRVIGFDNERGKGDHCHIRNVERKYVFSSIEQLIEDFISEVDRWRTK